jgi:hypothetical protein
MYLKKATPVIMPCVNLGPPQVRWQGLFSLFSYEGGR